MTLNTFNNKFEKSELTVSEFLGNNQSYEKTKHENELKLQGRLENMADELVNKMQRTWNRAITFVRFGSYKSDIESLAKKIQANTAWKEQLNTSLKPKEIEALAMARALEEMQKAIERKNAKMEQVRNVLNAVSDETKWYNWITKFSVGISNFSTSEEQKEVNVVEKRTNEIFERYKSKDSYYNDLFQKFLGLLNITEENYFEFSLSNAVKIRGVSYNSLDNYIKKNFFSNESDAIRVIQGELGEAEALIFLAKKNAKNIEEKRSKLHTVINTIINAEGKIINIRGNRFKVSKNSDNTFTLESKTQGVPSYLLTLSPYPVFKPIASLQNTPTSTNNNQSPTQSPNIIDVEVVPQTQSQNTNPTNNNQSPTQSPNIIDAEVVPSTQSQSTNAERAKQTEDETYILEIKGENPNASHYN